MDSGVFIQLLIILEDEVYWWTVAFDRIDNE
jgi:hypothetical protein